MDVTTFYPLEGEDGLEACLEIAERPRHLVQRRYGLIVDRRSGRLVPAGGDAQADPGPVGAPLVGARPTARVVEYWDDEYFAYLVDGHLVRRGRHGYGAIPYVHAYGDQTPSRDPAKAGVSMLASMEFLIPLLDQLLTMKQNALFLYAYPTPKITNFSPIDPNLGNDGRPRALDFQPGQILPLYAGEDLTFLQWQGTPPDLDELIAQTRAMIDQAGAPSVLFGIPPEGNTSGYLLNQLINTARVSFQQIARHAEQALERVVQLMWRLVETRIGEPVFVFEAEDEQGWIGLGPQDIDGYHAVRVRLDPSGTSRRRGAGNPRRQPGQLPPGLTPLGHARKARHRRRRSRRGRNPPRRTNRRPRSPSRHRARSPGPGGAAACVRERRDDQCHRT